MSRKQLALFEPTLVVQALKEAVKKLNPQAQWRNPVMFIVWIGSLLTTCISIAMASGAMPGNALFSAAISGWLWVKASAATAGKRKKKRTCFSALCSTLPFWRHAASSFYRRSFLYPSKRSWTGGRTKSR